MITNGITRDERQDSGRLLWAKTGQARENGHYHPLLCHMLDVAAVAGLVWDYHLTPGLRNRLASALGGADGRSKVMFLSGAHDIGKACPSFQKKVPNLCQLSGLPFSENDQNRPHGFVTAHALNAALGGCSASALLAQIIGGHHGVFPRSADLRLGADSLGNNQWKTARDDNLKELAKRVHFGLERATKETLEITDPFVVPVLAGFVSVIDWIGSNQDFFPCAAQFGVPLTGNPDEYWKKSNVQARRALEELGWLPSVDFARETEFDKIFPFSPNDLQKKVIHLAQNQTSPYLMIVEAPMGLGKTEAALYAADLAMCRGFARGMYIAMPTQATGNAMFKRVLDDYLKKRGHQGKLNLQLVHGNALLAQMAEVQEGEIPEFLPKNIENEGGDVEAQSWFTAKKRPLLAPFGVGTIDQSLLSVLQTKHWFVRLFGLAGKVVIFDEVHAYDAYMSTILERLLHWLAELDCTVILLSATLPEAKRTALAKAYSGRDDAECKRYPRITLAKPRHYPASQTEEIPTCEEVPLGDARPLNLKFAGTSVLVLNAILTEKIANGGCAAVICNTVDRAIDVYKHLRDNLEDTECLLFNARTLQRWRREREEEVLRKFGKRDPQETDADGPFVNPGRPSRSVLVATQVIEQSLDLDFDLMISEMAPIDLLLQRAGRLHRHPRKRPQNLKTSQFVVLCDAETTGPPPDSFGKSIEYVYDRYILLRTWMALRKLDKIEVPAQIESLVEVVYGWENLNVENGWSDALEEAKKKMEFERTESEKAAWKLLVSRPRDPSELIEQFNDQLADDEDPTLHATVRAATRESEPSITVVMVDENTPLTAQPKIAEVRELLDHSAKLSHRGVYHAILRQGESPREWAKNAHLRHARLLRLDEQGKGRVGNYLLTVDENLGVVITKDAQSNG